MGCNHTILKAKFSSELKQMRQADLRLPSTIAFLNNRILTMYSNFGGTAIIVTLYYSCAVTLRPHRRFLSKFREVTKYSLQNGKCAKPKP